MSVTPGADTHEARAPRFALPPAEPAPAPERCADHEPLQLRAGWSIGAPELAMAALGELSDACDCGDVDACRAIFLTMSFEEPSFEEPSFEEPSFLLTPDAVCARWGKSSAARVFQSLVAVMVASFDQYASLAPPEEVAAWCASRGNADVCAAVVMVADPAEDWIGLHDFVDAACQGGSGLACALQAFRHLAVLDPGLSADSSWSADVGTGRSLSQVTALVCGAHVEFSCRTLVELDVVIAFHYPDLPTSAESLAWLTDFCNAGDERACGLRDAHQRTFPPRETVPAD